MNNPISLDNQKKNSIPKHCGKEMKYQWSDADDLGGIEEWFECTKCGKSRAIK